MKPSFRILLLATIFFAGSFLWAEDAADSDHWWGTYYTPGNVIVDAHASGGDNAGILRLGGEFVFSKIFINDTMPMDFGVNVVGMTGFYTGEYESGAMGAGAGFTTHIGFRGFGGRFSQILEKTDVFTDLGLGYTYLISDNFGKDGLKSWTGIEDSPFTLYSSIGVAYHISDNSAFTFGNANWGPNMGVFIGFRIKSGPKQPIHERPEQQNAVEPAVSAARSVEKDLDIVTGKNQPDSVRYEPLSDGEAEFYLNLFKQLYGGVFSHGGFSIDDYNFIEGEGTIFNVKIYDDAKKDYREIEVTKALLKRDMDTSVWSYRLGLEEGGAITYEFTLDANNLITELAVIREETVSTYIPDYPMEWGNSIVMYQDDFSSYTTGSERRTIKSGTFSCDRMFYDAGSFTYTWLVSDDIPGYVIEFGVEENGRIIIDGHLKEISLKNTSIIGD